jgi:hypothetical protein
LVEKVVQGIVLVSLATRLDFGSIDAMVDEYVDMPATLDAVRSDLIYGTRGWIFAWHG